MRRSTTKGLIGRRVASIVKGAISYADGVGDVSVTTSDYLIITEPGGPRFEVICTLDIVPTGTRQIFVGVTKEEHDHVAEHVIGVYWVAARVAAEILRQAVDEVVANAVKADRATRKKR